MQQVSRAPGHCPWSKSG